MKFARPHFLLLRQLKKSGFEWCSIMGTDDWASFWDQQLPPPDLRADVEQLKTWLEHGYHAEMGFLSRNMKARENARLILENVNSILSLVIPYAVGEKTRGGDHTHEPRTNLSDQISDLSRPALAKVTARYARVSDYHRALRKELDTTLLRWQDEALAQGFLKEKQHWRVVTDSLPFLDRAHARIARLGFIGKNTMLIRPGIGSYFFIAHVLMSAPFSKVSDPSEEKPTGADAIAELSCGDCTRCLDACPTQALSEARLLDANKCLSYLSIEHRGIIKDEFLQHFAERFYGCDICQEVCPYNFKTLPLKTIAPFQQTLPILHQLTIRDVALMSPSQYEKWFGGSAMTRAKYSGLVRNALYSLHALRSAELKEILSARAADPDPLIQATVEQISKIQVNKG